MKSLIALALLVATSAIYAGSLTVNGIPFGPVNSAAVDSSGNIAVVVGAAGTPPAAQPPAPPAPPPVSDIPGCPPSSIGLSVRDVVQNLGTKKTYYNGANQALAVRFVAGSSQYGSVGWVMPVGATWTSQLVVVSSCRGDFVKPAPCRGTGTQNTLFTTTGTTTYCPLVAGQVYYANIRNNINADGTDSCPAGKVCGVTLELK